MPLLRLSYDGTGALDRAPVPLQSPLDTSVTFDPLDAVTVALLVGGAVVMAYSAVWTRRLLRSVEDRPSRPTWQVLFGLTLFFITGYVAAGVLVVMGRTAALLVVTGAVFFAGAVFVLLVVRTSHRTVGELTETTSFLDDVLDSMGEALLVVSEDGSIERVNPAAMALFARERDAIVGRPVDELFSDGTRPFDALDDPGDRSGEATVVAATGEPVPVLFSASRLALNADDGRGVVCIVRDITNRKQQELELRRQNDRLDDFASVVSHDLRNPLGIAQGHLELARESGAASHFERVDEALDRIERLIQGLLELARQGESVGETRPVPLEETARVAWGTVDTAGATLSTADDLGTVQADRERLRQAFENLFSNAVEHGSSTPPSPTHDDVVVSVGRLSDDDGFFVADDGRGIPSDERELVFSHGFSTEQSGTGFGLAIVQTIVDAHGWTLSLTESEAGGARFEVSTTGSRAGAEADAGVTA